MSESCTTNCGIYNQSSAYTALYYAYASYCDPSDINKWDCKWCTDASNDFATKLVINNDYLQTFIGFDNTENRIVISFRGTHNYHDWFKDMEYSQIPYPEVSNAYVHEGFFNAYIELRKAGLIDSLQQLLSTHPDIHNILISGHSLGGALTNLCALDIIDNNIIDTNTTDIELYTFGCPRWANKDLAEYFNDLEGIAANWRIVNKHDPVAIVPGKFLGEYGFYHTSKEVLYTDYQSLEYVVCDGSGEDPKCGYSLWSEEEDAHLWYLNTHEHCDGALDDADHHKSKVSLGTGTVNEGQSAEGQHDGDQYGDNFTTMDTHWELSLLLIVIGFIVGIIYYFAVKKCQKVKGYSHIPEAIKREEEQLRKKRKRIMKQGLLEGHNEHTN